MAPGPGKTLDDDNVLPTSQLAQIGNIPQQQDAAATLLGDAGEWEGDLDTSPRPGMSDRTVSVPIPTGDSGPQAPVPPPPRKVISGISPVPPGIREPDANARRTVLNSPAVNAVPAGQGKIITGSRPRPAFDPGPEPGSKGRSRAGELNSPDPEKVISGSRPRPPELNSPEINSGSRPRPSLEATPVGTPQRRVITGERPRPPPESTEPNGRELSAQLAVPRGDALTGLKLGEYEVMERVGTGGMSTVYRARQQSIGKDVAVKILRTDVVADERDMEQLLHEARVVNAIHHPGIINIFSAGKLPDGSGRQYLVMEFLEGESLEQRLERENRIPLREAVPIIDDVMSALAAAHQAGVVHRDIKPANIFLIRQPDGKPWVKLVDFGLARPSTRREVSRVAGTPDYISPEHARGKPAGPAADIYSLGVLAFVLVTGKLPFTGATAHEVMEKHVKVPPPSPLSVEPTVPSPLNALILRMLEKDPTRRPDGTQVRNELKHLLKTLSTSSSDRDAGAITRDSGRAFPGEDSVPPDTSSDARTLQGRTAPMPIMRPAPDVTPTGAKATLPAGAAAIDLPRRPFFTAPVLIAAGIALLAVLAALYVFFFSTPRSGVQVEQKTPEQAADWAKEAERQEAKEKSEKAIREGEKGKRLDQKAPAPAQPAPVPLKP